ncbi:hypothetical protein RIR_jg34597.t1 [Rhizophagus irregularis DAOM 181602=DAOM 197198]|nr:hypothetical protein RIR_jg34597.t1 [Rhizophagus irregularis DAOM 181602=DAOM 197198]
MLLKLGERTKEILLKRNNRKTQPILIIIDGVDGVGKTTIVENIIRKIEAQNLKIIFNTFKRRRGDNKLFETPTIKYEWMFRKEVVEQINKRLVTYTGNLDKSDQLVPVKISDISRHPIYRKNLAKPDLYKNI